MFQLQHCSLYQLSYKVHTIVPDAFVFMHKKTNNYLTAAAAAAAKAAALAAGQYGIIRLGYISRQLPSIIVTL